MNLIRLTICFLLVSFIAPGCSRTKSSDVPTATPANKSVSAEALVPPEAASVPPAPGASANTENNASAPPAEAAESPAAAREKEILRLKPPQAEGQMPNRMNLIWACDRFLERNGRDAKSVEELVAKGLIKVPPPPAGKKYLLNISEYTLEVVNK